MKPHLSLIRAATAAILMLPGAGLAQGAAPQAGAAPDPAAQAAVNMEATVKAAQIDPQRADDTRTPGARASVMRVEHALEAKDCDFRR